MGTVRSLIKTFSLLPILVGINLVACSSTDSHPNDIVSGPVISLNDSASTLSSEIAEDIKEDPCIQVTKSTDPGWCTCQPQCCQSQLWFCPPIFGEPSYYKKEVIVDICDENLNTCVYSQDLDCPPPEIIYEGECTEAYECPPSAQNLDYGWQWCEMSDGTMGQQNIRCDKGQLYTSPCQPCSDEICDGIDNDCDGLVDEEVKPEECQNECGIGISICVAGALECFGPLPQEEICDGLDNDCDNLVDEGQTNICGKCGPVPAEICNGFDDNCNGLIDEDLVKVCSTVCGTGAEVCTDGKWAGCSAQQPQDEICDGLDNDCNGQIDDGIQCLCTVQDVGSLFPCAEPPLFCGQGFKTCECIDDDCLEITTTDCFAICHWLTDPPGIDPLCDSLVGMPLEEEECNNFDDNCNLLIDEDLFVNCYTGPENTLGVGICLPGQMTCFEGTWGSYGDQDAFLSGVCIDEVLPQSEICDGLDNDCDGEVDWGEEIPDTDILFVVDGSGSMSDEISAVLVALNQFAASFALDNKIQWGLVVGPVQLSGEYEERLLMVSDVTSFEDFLTSFSALGNSINMNGSFEMLLDAFALALKNISSVDLGLDMRLWNFNIGESIPPKDQFKISWRPNADRVVIVFSDEIEQSYLNPKVTLGEAISTCSMAPKLKTYTFSKFPFGWEELAVKCGGKRFQLSNDATEMYGYLMEILDEICMSSE